MRIPRRGDHVLVMVDAADGVCCALLTPDEYAALWRGVDEEVTDLITREQRDQ